MTREADGRSPILILPPRFSEDSIRLWRAAGRLGWRTERLDTWRAPFKPDGSQALAIYGGLAFLIAEDMGLSLIEPPLDWLTRVPRKYLGRDVNFTHLAAARAWPRRRSSSRRMIRHSSRPCTTRAHWTLPHTRRRHAGPCLRAGRV